VLGRIPLAITQAAAFMRRNRMSLQKCLEILERDEQNLKDSLSMELQDHRREREIPNSVFRTWKLSYNQMREQEPRAATLLSLMASTCPNREGELCIALRSMYNISWFDWQ
jgi:hypothetical protein